MNSFSPACILLKIYTGNSFDLHNLSLSGDYILLLPIYLFLHINWLRAQMLLFHFERLYKCEGWHIKQLWFWRVNMKILLYYIFLDRITKLCRPRFSKTLGFGLVNLGLKNTEYRPWLNMIKHP